ncbi:hypothetical protein ACWEF6_10355 [Amycolatopsis sp. NPDC004772]
MTRESWNAGIQETLDRICLPDVDERALAGLKFSDALPHRLAMATLATRLADLDAARELLLRPVRFVVRA